MLAHAFHIIIDWCVVEAGRVREIVEGLNSVDKIFLSISMIKVQLPSSKGYYMHMSMHTPTQKYYRSLARKLQEHLSEPLCKICF